MTSFAWSSDFGRQKQKTHRDSKISILHRGRSAQSPCQEPVHAPHVCGTWAGCCLCPQSGWGHVTCVPRWAGWCHTTQEPLMLYTNAVGRMNRSLLEGGGGSLDPRDEETSRGSESLQTYKTLEIPSQGHRVSSSCGERSLLGATGSPAWSSREAVSFRSRCVG